MKTVSFAIVALLMSSHTYADSMKGNHDKWAKNKASITRSLETTLNGSNFEDYSKNMRKVIKQEMLFSIIQDDLIKPLEISIRKKDHPAIKNKVSSHFQTNQLGILSKSTKSYAHIDEISWKKTSKKENLNELTRYINSFSNIDHVELAVIDYNTPSKKVSSNEIKLKAIFDIRGMKQAKRRNDQASLSLHLIKENNNWKLKELNVIDAKTYTTQKEVSFKRLSNESFANLKTYQRKEAIRRGGYALSTTDIDKDGNTDIYVGAYGNSQILKGLGNSQFKSQNFEGIQSHSLVKSAAFYDFDNDNDQDLMLVRFNPNNRLETNIIMYENKNGKFIIRNDFPTGYQSFYAMPSTVADFNNDSFLDFYVGFPGAKDFTTLTDPKSVKGNLIEGLFLNKGKISFVDVSDSLPSRERKEIQTLFPHGSLASDMDLDGDMDIIVVDDRGHISPAYQNDGKGKFSLINQDINFKPSDYGMTVTLGDINNDGLQDIALSSVNFNAALRMYNALSREEPAIQKGTKPVYLYINKGKKFEEESDKWGLSYAGEGAAGIEFIDYNNDGHLDLYLTNGLWSGSEDGEDLSSLFLSSVWTDLAHIEHAIIGKPGHAREIAHSMFMNILTHYQGKDGAFIKGKRPHLAGLQRNRLFRNTGENNFIEVGYLEGIDSIADGYVLAKADINNDNYVDLVLRNGDPGTSDVHYSPIEVYLNNNRENNTVKLTFSGTNSNRDAVGVTARAKIGKKWHVRHLHGNNGTTQSEKFLSFGLGQNKNIDQLEVQWPSGTKTVLKNVSTGHHHIKESTSNYKVTIK